MTATVRVERSADIAPRRGDRNTIGMVRDALLDALGGSPDHVRVRRDERCPTAALVLMSDV